MNKEVLRHLKNIIYDEKVLKTWDKELSFVQRIINSSVNSRLGVTPAEIIFGFSNRLEISLPDTNIRLPLSRDEIKEGLIRQADIITAAQQSQFEYDREHIKLNDKKLGSPYKEGDYVLAKRRNPNKLDLPFEGPFKVLGVNGNNIKVFNINKGLIQSFHVTCLIRYNTSSHKTEEEVKSVALRDGQYYNVEKIVSHKGSWKTKTRMTFEVKWEDYDDKANTFESYETLKRNIKLHEYFIDKGHKDLILKSYVNTLRCLEEVTDNKDKNNLSNNKGFLYYLFSDKNDKDETNKKVEILYKSTSTQTRFKKSIKTKNNLLYRSVTK